MTPPSPSGRALAGIALLLALIVLLGMLVARLSPTVGHWPVLIQGLCYVAIVILWTMPLKLLIRWIVTGRIRAPGKAPQD